MLKAIIIDDENSNIEITLHLLKKHAPHVNIVATANSVELGYKAIKQHSPDLVFLDVQMPDGNCFDLLNQLKEINFKFILITAHHEFAIEAFKYSTLDYLLKPILPEELVSAIKKAEQAISIEEMNLQIKTLLHNASTPARQKRKIVLKTFDKIYAIQPDEIIRFESEGSYTTVYLINRKKITVSRLIKEFDEILSNNGFARVHQSHLINMEHVFCYEKSENTIIMKDDAVVPVSSRKKEFLMNLIQIQD